MLFRSASVKRWWQGSLISDKEDATRVLYRRNRYYDPNSGRFTQEDPVGLAGGLNLYGFAAGDPVNYSDPFGLCPPVNRETWDCGSTYYAGLIARGKGVRAINEIAGAITACNEDEDCARGMWSLIGAGAAAVRGGGIGLTTRRVGGQGVTSVNQMNRQILRGGAPRGINRVDVGKVRGEQDNVHFDDGTALNRDGTWKHGEGNLTNAQKEWLLRAGWQLP